MIADLAFGFGWLVIALLAYWQERRDAAKQFEIPTGRVRLGIDGRYSR